MFEILGIALGLVRMLIYYLLESLIFGLVINLIWIFLFKNLFELDISYLQFVGFLFVYRILLFDMTKHSNNINEE